MSEIKLAILGIGNPRCGIPVIASLAQYFGERPLEIRFYDSDAELLDCYDRLARLAFKYANSTHCLISTEDHGEALEEADRVIFQFSHRSADLFAKRHSPKFDPPTNNLEFAVRKLLSNAPRESKVLTLLQEPIEYPFGVFRLPSWPPPIPDEEIPLVLHQVHRYILDEEPMFEMLRPYEKTPLMAWLDDPKSAEFVSRAK